MLRDNLFCIRGDVAAIVETMTTRMLKVTKLKE